MSKLLDRGKISDFEFLITFSYFTTPLVHKTLSERITIHDRNGVRYMSKQNVHQHITGKVIGKIVDYAKDKMPNEFAKYFRIKYDKRFQNADN